MLQVWEKMDEKGSQYVANIGWEGGTYDGGKWKELGNNKGDREKTWKSSCCSELINRLRAGGGNKRLQSVLRIKLLNVVRSLSYNIYCTQISFRQQQNYSTNPSYAG